MGCIAAASLQIDSSGKAETLQQCCASGGMIDACAADFCILERKYACCAGRAKGCDRRPSTEPLPSTRRISRDMAPLTMMMRDDGGMKAEAAGG